jgi:chromosome segregation ATPase
MAQEMTALMERLEASPNPSLRSIGQAIRESLQHTSRLEVELGEALQEVERLTKMVGAEAQSRESTEVTLSERIADAERERDELRIQCTKLTERSEELEEQLKGFIRSPRLDAFDDHRDALEASVEAALALARATKDHRGERQALEARHALQQLIELSWQRERLVVSDDQQTLQVV